MNSKGILYSSSITEKDRMAMSRAYIQAHALRLPSEQDCLHYVDSKTHPFTHTCSICGEEYFGWGHNAKPIVDDGRCCAKCNANFVIPARLDVDDIDNASDVMVFSSMEELVAFAQTHEIEFNPHGWGAEAA